jgi:hypothetical protein
MGASKLGSLLGWEDQCGDRSLEWEDQCEDRSLEWDVQCEDRSLKWEVQCEDRSLGWEDQCEDRSLEWEVQCEDRSLEWEDSPAMDFFKKKIKESQTLSYTRSTMVHRNIHTREIWFPETAA